MTVTLPAGSCGKNEAESGQLSSEVIAVTVQQARLGSLRDVVTAAGTVVPLPAADFIVTATESSEIVGLPKNEGDTVQTGDVLVRLDVFSITNEIATRQLEMGEATLRTGRANADADRLGKLFAQGLAARNQWEAARTASAAADTDLNQARARLDAAKALETNSVIRARFSGVVVKRWHAPGDMVAGGESDPILRVVDPARLQVALQVPREQAERISAGQTAAVQTSLGAEAAVVAQQPAAPGGAGTSVEVRLTFLAPSALAIDTAVQAEIVLEQRQNVLVIPASAIQRTGGAPFVWLATDNAHATKREIRAGLTTNGLTEIVSGLAVGDQVIVTGLAQLNEGTAISISRN